MIILKLTRFCHPLTLLNRWEFLSQNLLNIKLAKIRVLHIMLQARLTLVCLLIAVLVFIIFVARTTLCLRLLVFISQELIRLRLRQLTIFAVFVFNILFLLLHRHP